MMTSANDHGHPATPGFTGGGYETPDENLWSLTAARAMELPGAIVAAAQAKPIVFAGGAAVIVGAVIGLLLGGRKSAPKQGALAAPVALKRAAKGSWAESGNYAELAELIAKLVRNPLIRQVLIGVVVGQIKRRARALLAWPATVTLALPVRAPAAVVAVIDDALHAG